MEPSEIPEAAIHWSFMRSRGPGGQNVNKVATAVQLRVQPRALGEPDRVVQRLLRIAGNRATREGEIVLFCDSTRSQARNRELALERLCSLIEQARKVPKQRIATRPSRAAKAARLDRKKRQGERKQSRRKPGLND